MADGGIDVSRRIIYVEEEESNVHTTIGYIWEGDELNVCLLNVRFD